MLQNERMLKEMSAGDIIDYSVEVYKRNFKKVTMLSLIFYVPFSFLYAIVTNSFSSDFFMVGETQNMSSSADAASILVPILMGILYLFYIMTIGAVMSSAVSKVIYDDMVYQRERKLKTIIKESFNRFVSLFGYKALLYLILVGIISGVSFVVGIFFSILIVIAGLFGVTAAGSAGMAGLGVFVVILVLLYVLMGFAMLIAGGFFYIKFGFGVQVIATENRNATDGISRSINLSKSNFKSSFGALFFGYIFYYFIPVVAVGVVQVLSFMDPEVYKGVFFLVSTAIQLIQSIFYPFIVTMMTVTFINMKIKNEGLDLEVKVNGLLEQQNNTGAGEQINA